MEICRHGCLDHCQSSDSIGHYAQERKDVNVRPLYTQTTQTSNSHEDETNVYDDIIQNGDDMASIGSQFLGVEKSSVKSQAQPQISNQIPPQPDNQQVVHPEDLHIAQQLLVTIFLSSTIV